ncbi:MAG: hypothetical protein NW201_14290 [Gemmatimonadales bacterium]|nr:hypothetical protein [Gemmatimonadales bacterium]
MRIPTMAMAVAACLVLVAPAHAQQGDQMKAPAKKADAMKAGDGMKHDAMKAGDAMKADGMKHADSAKAHGEAMKGDGMKKKDAMKKAGTGKM